MINDAGYGTKRTYFFIRGSQSANTILHIFEKCLYAAMTVFISGVYSVPAYRLGVLSITAVNPIKFVLLINMCNK